MAARIVYSRKVRSMRGAGVGRSLTCSVLNMRAIKQGVSVGIGGRGCNLLKIFYF